VVEIYATFLGRVLCFGAAKKCHTDDNDYLTVEEKVSAAGMAKRSRGTDPSKKSFAGKAVTSEQS